MNSISRSIDLVRSALIFAALILYISAAQAQVPPNDVCANAIPLTLNADWLAASNTGTVSNGPNLSCGGGTLIRDVWYSFQYSGGDISITTQLGSLLDTRIGVRTACGAALIACNDDVSDANYTSIITLGCTQLTPGSTYFIQAGGYNGHTGSFSIRASMSDTPGCTNPIANNYNACANLDNGTCTYDPLGASWLVENIGLCGSFSKQFTSTSSGYVVSYNWTFVGGTPSTSSELNPVVTYAAPGVYGASLTVVDFNGTQSTYSQNITVAESLTLEIDIVQDNYPQETTWDVIDSQGQVVASGGAAGGTVCLFGSECYNVNIYDSFGDGICCGYGQGSYTILLEGELIATGGQFTFEESVLVNCPPGIDCNNAIEIDLGTYSAPLPNSWFVFTPESSGQYLFNTCGLTDCNTTIYIYDYCNMANFDDSNEATLTYNEDFCGLQSQITPILQGGETYYLRIWWDEDPISAPCSKQFFIDYLGPIPGCMDINACNYDPIAELATQCYYNDDPECDDLGPDLEVRGTTLFSSMYYTTINATDACLVEEGCIQGFGTRQLVRFTTWIDNIGNQDYYVGNPSQGTGQFEFDPCHGHYHYEGYSEYVLFDSNGNSMPQVGFKNGFCVLDLTCPAGGVAKFTCGNMGITAGCADYYSSGLSCQWIDITDVPAGTYTMMVRVNWDQSPDANGNFELRYDNNWAAVCITFERDANNNVINFTKSLDCIVPVDCIGQPYGDALPDCASNCPGVVVTGDLNASLELEHPDVEQYLLNIIGNDALVSPCTDIDLDGAITVTDAALVADCINYGPAEVTESGVHNHCVFGESILNPNHSATLSIGSVNTVDQYFDIYILNTDSKVVGYEFSISGATILSAQNMVDAATYDIQPLVSLGGNHIVGLSVIDQQIPKNYTPAPLVRVYYFTITQPEVCISEIMDIVNEDYHNVLTLTGPCVPSAGFEFANFSANTASVCQGSQVQFTDLSTNATNSWAWNFSGGSPASSSEQHPMITYNVPGTYGVSLTATNGSDVDAITQSAYITVSPSSDYFLDGDGDGFGHPDISNFTCLPLIGFVSNNSDCDDSNAAVFPGAPATATGVDNDCNGTLDPDETQSSPCVGDFDGNGLVGFADFNLLIAEFGCIANCSYDLTGDGMVNFSDISTFLINYGNSCP